MRVTRIKLLIKPTLLRSPPRPPGSIIVLGVANVSTTVDWAKDTVLYAYDVQAITACQTCHSWQKLACFSHGEGPLTPSWV